MTNTPKPIVWLKSTLEDLRRLPPIVRQGVGYALECAQKGGRHSNVKTLKGFVGSGVVEIVESFDGNTYRAVYTTKYKNVIYVLHVFQKKSKTGIKTPKKDIELIKDRLKLAREDWLQQIDI